MADSTQRNVQNNLYHFRKSHVLPVLRNIVTQRLTLIVLAMDAATRSGISTSYNTWAVTEAIDLTYCTQIPCMPQTFGRRCFGHGSRNSGVLSYNNKTILWMKIFELYHTSSIYSFQPLISHHFLFYRYYTLKKYKIYKVSQ